MSTATVEIELVSPLRGTDLTAQFRPAVVALNAAGAVRTARFVAAGGTLHVRLDLDRRPGETLAELAVRATSALLAAMRSAGVPPRLYTEKSLRIATAAPARVDV